jgi:predicted PurR-regulated permease PerM
LGLTRSGAEEIVLQSTNKMVPVSRLDLETWLLVFFLFCAIWLMFGMIKPFLDAIIIAALFAIITNPLYHRLLVLLHGRESLAALVISLLLTILIVIPCFFMVWQLLQETTDVFQALVEWTRTDTFQEFMKKPIVVRLSTSANRYLAEIQRLTGESTAQNLPNQMVVDVITSVARQVLDNATYMAQHAISVLGNFLLMIVAFFFMIRDQQEVRGALLSLLPFTRGHENEICEEVIKITRSTLLGSFLTAIAQAAGAAVGFWFSGVPVLFGAVATGFASFIPVIGTGVVWLPATLYLLFTNKVGSAVFLSIWWLIVVVFILDDVLRPMLMSGQTRMNTPLVFLSILGGIHFFGLLGVLYGPLVLGALYILVDLYDLTLAAPGTKEDGRG